MDPQIKKLPKSEVEIKITVEPAQMQKYREQAISEISKDLKIPGFRPGHIPPEIVEEKVGQTAISSRAEELAIQGAYVQTVIKEKFEIIGPPKITVDSREPFSFTATAPVMPEVSLGDYTKIKVAVAPAKIEDKEVSQALDHILAQHTEYKETDKPAQKGDRLEIDFEGFDKEGNAVPNTASKNHPVVLGNQMLVPGFEDQLIGTKKGEKKEFDLTFPKDYFKKDFQGKKLKFKTEIKKVELAQKPEMNDEFIEKITGKKMKLEDFEKEIRETMEKNRATDNRYKAEGEYIEKLVKILDVQLPDQLIEEEQNYMVREFEENLKQRGLNLEDYFKHKELTPEKFREEKKPDAENRVKARLALKKAVELEKIAVSNEEINEELATLKSMYPESEHAKIDKDFETGQLRPQIVNRITLKKFFDKVLQN